ncbi:MAG: CoA protein activase [Clostridia bacterium]|nr:CoA protein activase [Clostridia bacterium]
MKITFPHMGKLAIPLYSIFSQLGFEVILPPNTCKETIKLGSQYAPEQICLPFKINLGNLIQAHQLGADTLVMLGGCGPCRFGYYGALLKEILADMGINYQFIYFDENILRTIISFKNNCRLSWLSIYRAVRLGWYKLIILEELEERIAYIKPGLQGHKLLALDRKINDIFAMIHNSASIKEVNEIYNLLPSITKSDETMLKILLVGDIFTILEPESNQYLENQLAKNLVIVQKGVTVSHWLKTALIGLERSAAGTKILRYARPYLKSPVGGHGLQTIGNSVYHSTRSIHGIIHVMPFNCTPEIVAGSILPLISNERNVPILRLAYDEHYSDIGVRTRLEAFIDLIKRKNKPA